jgi:hypothetical protein
MAYLGRYLLTGLKEGFPLYVGRYLPGRKGPDWGHGDEKKRTRQVPERQVSELIRGTLQCRCGVLWTGAVRYEAL